MSFNDKGYPVVDTDGACINNGQHGACAGIGVYWGPNHQMNVSERVVGRQTNNTAEIQAATRAIKQAKQFRFEGINIRTDSEFVINAAEKWIEIWIRNNWRLSKGEPVMNAEDFKDLVEAMKGMEVKWTHVRAHSGDPGNEAADKLAKEGCLKN